MAAKEFTLCEVGKHTARNDVWITIHGKVYDVTAFLDDHPGGQEILFEQAGKDATEAFDEIGHSSSAHELLQQYYIGNLVERKQDARLSAGEAEDKKNFCTIGFPHILVAISVLAVGSFAAYRLFRQGKN